MHTNKNGKPVIRTEYINLYQYAQYYVSQTAMCKSTTGIKEPEKIQKCYVNASEVPYLVVHKIDKGSLFIVVKKNGKKIKKVSCAVGADVNDDVEYDTNGNKMGEGSLKLLQNLGKKNKKNTAYAGKKGDKFIVYKLNTKVGFVNSEQEIRKLAMKDKDAQSYLTKYKK